MPDQAEESFLWTSGSGTSTSSGDVYVLTSDSGPSGVSGKVDLSTGDALMA